MEAQYNLLSSISNRELNHDNELDDERNAVDESNKMAAYAFPAVLSSQAFPRHRVQKLLNHSQYKGISAEVEAEGLFIQLTSDGFPFRQVFLGLTQREFCIVKQEIQNFKSILLDKRDTETANLAIDKIIPLPVVHFLILDDSSKYFTILTYPGTRYRFEMCQLDSGSEEMWQKWRETILGLSEDPKCTDLNTWKTSYVIALHSGTADGSMVKSAYSKPVGFVPLRTIGIQANTECITDEANTECITGEANTECITDADTASNGNAIQIAHDVDLETDTDSSSSAEFDSFVKMRIGYHPKDRLAVLFTRSRFSPYNDTEDIIRCDRECIIRPYTGDTMRPDTGGIMGSDPDKEDVVWPDTEDTMRPDTGGTTESVPDKEDVVWPGTENSMRPDTYTIMRPNEEYIIKENKLRKTMSLNDLLDLQCQMLHMSAMEPCVLKKLSKARDKELESSSESDEDIDEWKREGKYEMEQHEFVRTARDLWSLVRSYVVPRKRFKTIGAFQDIVQQVHFRKLSQRGDTLAQSIRQLDVTDVSLQLAYMSRKLFLALSATDLETFTRSRGKEIVQSLQEILKFSEDIRKMVITEVLKSRSLSGSIVVLKFFIQVGLKLLFELHDFQSLMAIVRGLTSLPLYRLDNIWLTLFVQEPFHFCHFLTLVQFLNPSKQHAAYVARVSTCMRRKTPFIPLLDHILEHCLKCINKQHGDSHHWHYQGINTNTMYKKHDSSKMFKKSAFTLQTASDGTFSETNDEDHEISVSWINRDRHEESVSYENMQKKNGKSCDDGDKYGENNGAPCQETDISNASLSPPLMYYFDYKASNILNSAIKEAAELTEHEEMSMDSEGDSSSYSDASLSDTQQEQNMLGDESPAEDYSNGKDMAKGFSVNKLLGMFDEKENEILKGSSVETNEIKTEGRKESTSAITQSGTRNTGDFMSVENKQCDYGDDNVSSTKRKSEVNIREKEKMIKGPQTTKKKFVFVKKILKSFGIAKKSEFKHVKVLQNDIDEIADLMDSFKMFDFEENENVSIVENNSTTEASIERNEQFKENTKSLQDIESSFEFETNSKSAPDKKRSLRQFDIKEDEQILTVDSNNVKSATNQQNDEFKTNVTHLPGMARSDKQFVINEDENIPTADSDKVTDVTCKQNDDFKTNTKSLPSIKLPIEQLDTDTDAKTSPLDKNAAKKRKTKSLSDLGSNFKMLDDENISKVESNNTTETSIERNDQFKENTKGVQEKGSTFETTDADKVKNKAPNDTNKPTMGQSYELKTNSISEPDKKRSLRQLDFKEDGQVLTVDTNNVISATNQQNDEFKKNVNHLPGMDRSGKQFVINEDGNLLTGDSNNVTDVTCKQNDDFKTNTKSLPSIKMFIEQFDTGSDVQTSPLHKHGLKKRKTKSFSDLGRNMKILDTKKDTKCASEEVIEHKFKTTNKSLPQKMASKEIYVVEDKSVTADKNNATEAMIGQKFKKTAKALTHIMKLRKIVSDEEVDNVASVDRNKEEETTIDHNDGMKTNTDTLASMPRRTSYVPELVARGRRKSMFGEAIANKIEDEGDTDTFEHLKNVKLRGLKKKRSIVFDLLSPDEEDFVEDTRKSELSINVSKRSLVESVTNLFRNNNKSNSNIETTNDKYSTHTHNSGRKLLVRLNAEMNINITYDTESIPLSYDKCLGNLKWSTESLQDNFNQNSLNMLIKNDHDINYSGVAALDDNSRLDNYDNVVEKGSDNDFCSLCGNNVCLYKSGIGNHILQTRINLLKMRVQSCQRVEDFFCSVFTINNFLTDFDILQLSNQSG